MKKKKLLVSRKFEFNTQEDVKNFWKSQIWKLEVKKNVCSWLTVILNLIIATLNIATFILLILAIVSIIKRVNSPDYDPNNTKLVGIIFLVALSIFLSLGIIICSFALINIKNKNKFNIYQKICLDLNNLFINGECENIEEEIKKIIDKNLVFKKEKFYKTLKQVISEDKIKWT
ncbi:MAG: hypothetical protein ACRC1F_00925 [Metamycoplasmataceae bacterium]